MWPNNASHNVSPCATLHRAQYRVTLTLLHHAPPHTLPTRRNHWAVRFACWPYARRPAARLRSLPAACERAARASSRPPCASAPGTSTCTRPRTRPRTRRRCRRCRLSRICTRSALRARAGGGRRTWCRPARGCSRGIGGGQAWLRYRRQGGRARACVPRRAHRRQSQPGLLGRDLVRRRLRA